MVGGGGVREANVGIDTISIAISIGNGLVLDLSIARNGEPASYWSPGSVDMKIKERGRRPWRPVDAMNRTTSPFGDTGRKVQRFYRDLILV